ncbi:hypothetical protein [Aggregatibacter actinomycetemcomitans]|uniref:hypothetical protein n=1 Tax=Aggregatibacter actinomycetemcomitans TaxID=714 RepID=UPI001E326DC3|nr:hypothetical protein [Aggregatibacter actinomycetemcomitans]
MAKDIITLRNAVSDLDVLLDTFIRVRNLVKNSLFDLNGFVNIGVEEGLMSSNGRKGVEARIRSYNENQSLDSMPMQFKAFAEMYRLLGWLRSESDDKRTQYRVTFLGHLVSTLKDPTPLMEQCFLGIELPTGTVIRECTNKSRILWCYLRAIKYAQFPLKKEHFLYICHTIPNDEDYDDFIKRVNDVINFEHQNKKIIIEKVKEIAQNAGLQANTLGNSTRLTISALKKFGWTDNKKNAFSLTNYGNDLVEKYKSYFRPTYTDVITTYKNYLYDISVVGLIHLLERAKIDSSKVSEIKAILNYNTSIELLITNDIITPNTEFLFSPYQVLEPNLLKIFFGERLDFDSDRVYGINSYLENISNRINDKPITTSVKINKYAEKSQSNSFDGYLYREIIKVSSKNVTAQRIVYELYKKFSKTKKDIFYELVAESFRILGFQCIAERHGQNSIRWDAIIIDSNNSIPIEIKSPTEEKAISVKAIRQAIENRVILTARQTYKTNLNISSFVVGYDYPADRSEVYPLIESIHKFYGIKIALFSFRELLTIVVTKVINKKSPELNKFYNFLGKVHFDEN